MIQVSKETLEHCKEDIKPYLYNKLIAQENFVKAQSSDLQKEVARLLKKNPFGK